MSSGAAAPAAPASPGPAPRHGPAAWVVVLLTLAVVGTVLLAFAAGIGVGVWAGRASVDAQGQAPQAAPAVPAVPAPSGPQAPAPTGPAPPPPAGTSGGLDTCLVGSWRSTEHEESYETEQGTASLSGLERTMTFAPDGTQTVTYDASEATVTTEEGALPAVFEGTIVYRASTSDSTMSFELQEAEGTVTVLGPDGEVVEENPLEPGTGDVSYTCDETTFVQTATGYRSAYQRVG